MPPRRQYLPCLQVLPRRRFFRAGRTFRAETPIYLGISGSALPDSGLHPALFPLSPLAFPWLFLNGWLFGYPERAGIPKLEGGLSLLPRIFRRHQHLPLGCQPWSPECSTRFSQSLYDLAGLRRPPSRTLLHCNGSCAAPAHPRTISLYGSSAHNNVTEPVYESTHGTLPTQINPTIT